MSRLGAFGLVILFVAFAFIIIYSPNRLYAEEHDVITTTNGGTAIKIKGSNNIVNVTTGLKQPTFTEDESIVSFTFGEGIGVRYKLSDLEKSPKNNGYNFNGFRPVTLYAENGMIYADVKVYGGSGMPPIEVRHNKIFNVLPGWDINKNDTAFEIVNEKNVPVYQFFYKRPSYIVMNGIFPFPGDGLMIATGHDVVINPSRPVESGLKRIFKYPAWKYPGKFDE